MTTPTPTCPKHPKVHLHCPACIGARGGLQRSEAKTQAARRNSKLARPRVQPPSEGPVPNTDDGRPQ